jgi:leucyl/phenylalanyl-tRNA---protein transferase
MIFELDDSYRFPDPSLAEEDGLLAIGGDLSEQRLINAYHLGIFPWYNEEDPICWYAPHERCVIKPAEFHLTKSLSKFMRMNGFEFTQNKVFHEVIHSCKIISRKGQDGTWINDDMIAAYIKLHKAGWAHSFEIWKNGALAGGIYGVRINHVFCGESMFSNISNASKALMAWICGSDIFRLIDCQVPNPHLISLGAKMISRNEFMNFLNDKS